MATQVQFRGGTTTEHASFTGAAREVTVDTTKDTVVVHDGTTAGGFPLAKEASPAFTGDVSIPDKIVHTGDTNTAIRFPSADTITAETGGSERLRIASDGKVGIGTNSAEDLLHLQSGSSGASSHTAAQLILEGSGSANWIHFKNPNDQNAGLLWSDEDATEKAAIYYDHNTDDMEIKADDDIIFKTAGSERLRIDVSGKVGIGTSSPSYMLELSGTNSNNYLSLDNTTAGDADGNRYSRILFRGKQSGGEVSSLAAINSDHDGAADDQKGTLSFRTNDGSDGESPTERMRIDSSGYVGIADSSPASALSIKYTDTTTYSAAASAPAVGRINLFNTDTTTDTTAGEIRFGAGSSGSAYATISAIRPGSQECELAFRTSNNATLAEAVRIDKNGNVDISGALSKGSGSFKISHPLPEKTETHNLVHSFIEGPQADLIYSGMVTLVAGKAEINLDTVARMTEGTFLLLNTNLRRFVSNEGGWTAVRSSITGNVLTVEAQDDTCTDEVFWTVIGERKDQHMIDTSWTDENGRVITEPLKPVVEEES